MLPTLAPEGDFLLHLHLPFYRLVSPLLRPNPPDLISLPNVGGPKGKLDPAMGTGLRLGDLVVAVSPRDHSRMICKRVLGLPGDTVLVDPRVDAPSNHAEAASATPKPRYITVPRGHVWLGGDNLGNSTDSRIYGPVPLGLVQGVIVAKVWPRFSWLGNNIRPAQ
ncbi:LexA/Signal peptidase [Acaromyces ingoldii]|uniref:Mitochondrial inner membrane protease subunit n=1 Tax=Acaromyces ingoldii TaxID=215250 RepID=A0A316YWY4_9BASI|nr:LexA/Signal peptidase [Acaromyces ingoldii]PWN93178.1 LexA/Signal peptidase [Acaromyces ingoldii]